jgi:hypothetical protein
MTVPHAKWDLSADNPAATGATDVRPANATAPVDYPFHAITEDYDDFSKEEFDALCSSVRRGGLVVAVVVWRGQTVDGKHRSKACRKEGVPLRYDDITERCPTEEAMIAHVRALNEHRRANTKPLTSVQKRERIKAALKANPERPNLQIAQELGVSDNTVNSVRQEMEGRSQIANVKTRTDRQGRRQPARRKTTTPKKLRGAAVEGIDPPRDAAQPELPLNPTPVAAEAAAKSENQEPTFSDEDAPAPQDVAPRPEAGAAPPEPAEAPQPPDPSRDFLINILGAVAALSRVPQDADFDAMATIIDPSERERRKRDIDMAVKIARRLLIALERCDLDRGDPPTLTPAAAA